MSAYIFIWIVIAVLFVLLFIAPFSTKKKRKEIADFNKWWRRYRGIDSHEEDRDL